LSGWARRHMFVWHFKNNNVIYLVLLFWMIAGAAADLETSQLDLETLIWQFVVEVAWVSLDNVPNSSRWDRSYNGKCFICFILGNSWTHQSSPLTQVLLWPIQPFTRIRPVLSQQFLKIILGHPSNLPKTFSIFIDKLFV
jgi:hypothetical protein